MIRWLLAMGLALTAMPGVAQVYTYIDAQGNRVFTDQPRPGNAKKVQLPPGNRIPAPPTGTASAPATEARPEPLISEIVWKAGGGACTVTLMLNPEERARSSVTMQASE